MAGHAIFDLEALATVHGQRPLIMTGVAVGLGIGHLSGVNCATGRHPVISRVGLDGIASHIDKLEADTGGPALIEHQRVTGDRIRGDITGRGERNLEDLQGVTAVAIVNEGTVGRHVVGGRLNDLCVG
ncbi:hypothetical protein D3C85_1503730 [compost metagenome]